MDTSLFNLLNIYVFPGGRREFALARLHELARQRKMVALEAHCQAAIEHEQSQRELQRRYAVARGRRADPELAQLDPQLDRAVGAIYRIGSEAAVTLAGSPEGERASALVKEVFPEGVQAITLATYVEQEAAVRHVLSLLQNEYAAAVEELGLQMYVTRLSALNERFRALLPQEAGSEVTADAVRAGDKAGQHNLLQAVAMVLGAFSGRTDEDIRARQELLAPVMFQNEAIRAHYRARRAVSDVNPITGEEEPPVASDGAAAPTAAAVPPLGSASAGA